MVIVTLPLPPPTYTATPSQVVQLMGVDLLRQQQRWKDSLMEIRQIMASLVQVNLFPYHNLELELAAYLNQLMICWSEDDLYCSFSLPLLLSPPGGVQP